MRSSRSFARAILVTSSIAAAAVVSTSTKAMAQSVDSQPCANPNSGAGCIGHDNARIGNYYSSFPGLWNNVVTGSAHYTIITGNNGNTYINTWGTPGTIFFRKLNAGTIGDPDGGTALMFVNSNGLTVNQGSKPGGGSWASTSDIRLKKNVQPLEGALDKLLKLRGVTYEWNEPEKQGNLTGTQIGMIAQEVEAVFPEWVGTDSNGFKTLGFRGFEALSVESLRVLKKENNALRKEVATLDDRLKKLESNRPALAAGAGPVGLGAFGAIAAMLGFVVVSKRRRS